MVKTMEVRLLKRWGGRLPNQIVSVSVERAIYLEKEGIGKLMEPLPESFTKKALPGKLEIGRKWTSQS